MHGIAGLALDHLLESTREDARFATLVRRRYRFCGAAFVVDLSGWSALCEARTIVDALMRARAMHGQISALVGGHGGQVVKTAGDDLFAVFGDPARAVACGAEVISRCRDQLEDGLLAPCIGIASGEMLVVPDQDLWGAAVNRASRLAEDTATAGDLLVDQQTLDAIGPDRWKSEGIEYRLAGRTRLARKILL